jgi:hypothetical protein
LKEMRPVFCVKVLNSISMKILVGLLLAFPLQASILFSSYSGTFKEAGVSAYSQILGSQVTPAFPDGVIQQTAFAVRFVPAASGQISTLRIPLSLADTPVGTGTSFDVVDSNNLGFPGTNVIDRFTVLWPQLGAFKSLTISGSLHGNLAAGQVYFLVEELLPIPPPATGPHDISIYGVFFGTNVPATPVTEYDILNQTVDNVTTITVNGPVNLSGGAAFEITGTATPEPTTFLNVGCSLIGVFAVLRRRFRS